MGVVIPFKSNMCRERKKKLQSLFKLGTGAPTVAKVAAGQQGAGSASQCEVPAEWDGGEEDGVCVGDRDGGGLQRRKREKRWVQRRREQQGPPTQLGLRRPHGGRARAGGLSTHGRSSGRRVQRYTGIPQRGVEAPRPAYEGRSQRCYDTMPPGSGQTLRRTAVRAGVHTSGVNRQQKGAIAGQTSLGGAKPAARRPKRLRQRCHGAQE